MIQHKDGTEEVIDQHLDQLPVSNGGTFEPTNGQRWAMAGGSHPESRHTRSQNRQAPLELR